MTEAVLGQMSFDQSMYTDALQLRAQDQNLIGTQGMLLVDHPQHLLEGGVQLGVEPGGRVQV